MNNQNLKFAVIISALLIIFGVFLPLASIAGVTISYNQIATTESYLLILCALSAPVFIFLGKQRFSFVSAVCLWLVLLFPMIQNLFTTKEDSGISSLIGKHTSQITDKVGNFAADLFMNITDFSWGGFIFLLGIVLFTIVCVLISIRNS